MSLMHILLNSIDADMKSEIGSSGGGLRPYPLRFHVEKAGSLSFLAFKFLRGLVTSPE
jgi:hypothetical protein